MHWSSQGGSTETTYATALGSRLCEEDAMEQEEDGREYYWRPESFA